MNTDGTEILNMLNKISTLKIIRNPEMSLEMKDFYIQSVKLYRSITYLLIEREMK